MKSKECAGMVVPKEGKFLVLTNTSGILVDNSFFIHTLFDVHQPPQSFKAELFKLFYDYDLAVIEITAHLDGSEVQFADSTCDSSEKAPCLFGWDFSEFEYLLTRGDNIGVLSFPEIAYNNLVYTSASISSLIYESFDNERVFVALKTNDELYTGGSVAWLSMKTESH